MLGSSLFRGSCIGSVQLGKNMVSIIQPTEQALYFDGIHGTLWWLFAMLIKTQFLEYANSAEVYSYMNDRYLTHDAFRVTEDE